VQQAIEEAIIRKSKAILADQQLSKATRLKHANRFTKRTGKMAGEPIIQEPRWWKFHPHFDPRYCITHAKFLARVIWTKLSDGSYAPIPAVKFDIAKPDGSTRDIMAFAIPDSAVANVFHKSITKRNLNLFSSHSFAYRPDQNVFDAILHLRRSLGNPKSYIVQYDFKRYFDTIDPAYLRRLIGNRDLFLITSAERTAIYAFLSHEFAHVNDYLGKSYLQRTRGVPQGCSLSLFLSNAAAHELDLALDRQNGTFARFADDVVAVAHSYTDARDIALQFRAHCKVAGIEINYDKSPGILLFDQGKAGDARTFFLDADDGGRINTIDEFDYLGHKICKGGVALSSRAVSRIKRRISGVIYKHLLLYRRSSPKMFDSARVGKGYYDWDLVTCLNEIRRYLYGGLKENQIDGFLGGGTKLPFVRGLLAFYPLITDPRQLVMLDGWLTNVLVRALKERAKVLTNFNVTYNPLSSRELINGNWYQYPDIYNDTRLPSFVRGWRAARKYYLRYGLKSIEPPSYYSLLANY
jgi:RNA-directed DNA polymerase